MGEKHDASGVLGLAREVSSDGEAQLAVVVLSVPLTLVMLILSWI